MKNASTAALVGMWMILLTALVVTILYVGRQLLIPLALAAMLTFLLAPLVGYIERWIGRIAAVLIVVAMLFGVAGGAGWLLTRQLIDLAAKLPDYQTNIDNRLNAIRLPTGGAFGRFSHSVSELQKQSPDSLEPPANATGPVPETKATTAARSHNVPAAQQPMPVRIVESQSRLPQILQTAATGLLGPLGTACLVFVLVIFMLLKREDLRGRMIRLIGQDRISATHQRWPQSLATNQCRANDPTSRPLQATEQIQNQKDDENGSDYAVRPVAVSITACRESPD